MRKAEIRYNNQKAGMLIQDDSGYHFYYSSNYLQSNNPEPISLTLPLQEAPYESKTLFPFFDGLIPEGWLLEIAEKNWKLNQRDRMGLLLVCCNDCVGAVSVHSLNSEEK
ncbi:MAG: HipA N-terminal domain-containing protein [Bacteroidia bacterium]|nr:HipA N-terminal domain-containing protein [Bacteroidia bacterium]